MGGMQICVLFDDFLYGKILFQLLFILFIKLIFGYGCQNLILDAWFITIFSHSMYEIKILKYQYNLLPHFLNFLE